MFGLKIENESLRTGQSGSHRTHSECKERQALAMGTERSKLCSHSVVSPWKENCFSASYTQALLCILPLFLVKNNIPELRLKRIAVLFASIHADTNTHTHTRVPLSSTLPVWRSRQLLKVVSEC